jgi:NAD(P)-dependent dehydrogenase (short-subunit alcohol dehydrogenase family)
MTKRTLITGASRGIGRAIAAKLAAPNVTLLLHGRDTVALAETCKAVEKNCAGVVKLVHDLATEKGVAGLISQVGNVPLDVLINNAGIAVVKPFREITPEEWKQTLGVNVTAPFLLIQRFAGQMPPGSSIVNILSVAAKTAFANWSAYCMSKFALEGLSQSIREELRDRCVRVINIYPAATSTDIWDGVAGDWPRGKMIAAEQVADSVAFAIAQPSDVLVENITLAKLEGNL